MKINLPMELSFVQEGKHAEKLAGMMSNFSWLTIPKINWALTTDRVLTMDYCEGAHINDVPKLKEIGVDFPTVSRQISQLYADMIFKHGYVHCDPHPGNVLVRKRPSDGANEIILLDHGLYLVRLRSARRQSLAFSVVDYSFAMSEKFLGQKLFQDFNENEFSSSTFSYNMVLFSALTPSFTFLSFLATDKRVQTELFRLLDEYPEC